MKYEARVFTLVALVLGLLSGVSVHAGTAEQIASEIVISTEDKVIGELGSVSSEHPLASQAGLEMLQKGGNAVDAIVATVLVVSVVRHGQNGLGGYGGAMVIHRRDLDEPVVVDFNTRAPLAATLDMFYETREGYDPGILSVSAWNTVAGLAVALEEYGTLSWAEVLEPATRYAEEGFVIDPAYAGMIDRSYDRMFHKWPASRAIYRRPDGSPLRAGDRFVQKDLAESLRILAREGPAAIYTGSLARRMVDYIQSEGGLITMDDLANWRERHVRTFRPARTNYRGYDVYTSPVGTGGHNMITILNLLKGFDLPAMGRSAEAVHVMLEAFKLGFADRLWYAGDPWTVKVPYVGMMSEAYADERRQLIDPDVAWPYARPGDPWQFDSDGPEQFLTNSSAAAGAAAAPAMDLPQMIARNIPPMAPEGDTASTSAMDKDGNMVALTMTMRNTFGSGVTVPGTGITLNNGMGLFHPTEYDPEPVPNHPNRMQGGKLALNNMNAFLVLKDGQAFMTGGGSGGRRVMTECLELIVNVIDWGMDVQEAVSAPRFHVEQKEPSVVEAALPYGIGHELERKGHELEVLPAWGAVHAIVLDAETGSQHAAREPRHETSAAAALVRADK